ncbi:MAG TPA: hypothetical protein ENN29_13755 [Candidatus Hydrogenedentes bacterium]|nr:hypothetical protein [Candidatus Hydrogenedentota bacterium]
MSEEVRPGYYKDRAGNWQVDRRSGIDRRDLSNPSPVDRERRNIFRRQADRERYERDHKIMVEEALEDFAEEHGGHL